MFLTEFTPSYSLTHNGDDAPQNFVIGDDLSLVYIAMDFVTHCRLSEAYTLFMNGLCLMCSKAPASERGLEHHQDAITFHALSFYTR